MVFMERKMDVPTAATASQTPLSVPQTGPLLNRVVWVFSLLGIMVAGYLWFMHAHPSDIPCGPSHGCETVANSRYSRFPFGIGPPVAAFGTVGYVALTVLSFLRTLPEAGLPGRVSRDRVLLLLVVWGAGLGTLASLGLTYLEIAVIHAICKWCLGSQIIIAIIFVCAALEVVQRKKTMGKNVA